MMRVVYAIWRKELARIAGWPTFYVAAGLFAFTAALLTLEFGGLLGLGLADLDPLFAALPWLYCLFLPALTAGLWAGEARAGTLEVTLALPQPAWALALGKWLAAWTAAGVAIVCTSPLWVTINVLGAPDNAETALGYGMSFLAAGALLAFGSAVSAATRSETVAFALASAASFGLVMLGTASTQALLAGLFGSTAAQLAAALSVSTHLEAAGHGLLELRSVFYFAAMAAVFLVWTALALNARRAGVGP